MLRREFDAKVHRTGAERNKDKNDKNAFQHDRKPPELGETGAVVDGAGVIVADFAIDVSTVQFAIE